MIKSTNVLRLEQNCISKCKNKIQTFHTFKLFKLIKKNLLDKYFKLFCMKFIKYISGSFINAKKGITNYIRIHNTPSYNTHRNVISHFTYGYSIM